MRRLIKNILNNPLILFKIIYWNLYFLYLKIVGKKTLIYNMHYNYFYDTFFSIEKELPKNIICFYSYKNKSDLKQFLINKGCKNLISSDISICIKSDMFVSAEITGPDFPINLLRVKKMQIYHGIGIYNLYKKIDLLKRFDLHLSIGPHYDRFFIENNIKNFFKVGFPKTDRLFNDYYKLNEIKKEYKINNDKLNVMYSPHWSEYSSIHCFGEELIKKLVQRDINILVKVHDYIFEKFKEDKWFERLSILENSNSNIKFIKESDTQKFYTIADVVITDVGTTAGFETALANKILFIYDNQDWFKDNSNYETEYDMAKSAIKFKSLDEIDELMKKLLLEDSTLNSKIILQKDMFKNLKEKYLYNLGSASKKASKVIEKEICNG